MDEYEQREVIWEVFLEFLKTLMNLNLASEYCSGYGDSISDIDDLEEASYRIYEKQTKS